MQRAARLRILIITPSIPYPLTWGFGIRVYQLVRHLAERHAVTLLSYAYPEEQQYLAPLRRLCAAVHTVPYPPAAWEKKRWAQLASLVSPRSYQRRSLHSPQMQAAIDRLLAAEPFDVIQIESSQMGGFTFRSPALVAVDEHNIEYELLFRTYRGERSPARRLYNGLEYAKFRREERRCWRQADACVVTSAREAAIVQGHARQTPTAVVANGVDVEQFRPDETPVEAHRIVFTGLIRYRPNSDAALYCTREILPWIHQERPEVTLGIIGADPPAEVRRLAGPRVFVSGSVPDVRPYVRQAAVLVVPLRMGSGTRLKVLEGLAMGKAVVSTSLGCEGIDVRHGEHLLIADEPRAFAAAVLRLLADRELAATLGARGRALVERHYAWSRVAAQLDDLYAGLLANHPARR